MNDLQAARAMRLRQLHRNGALVLPNAWDAVSAALVVAAGAPAVATTSGGVLWSLGYADGRASRDDMVSAVRRIVKAVDVPVTADIEDGYGPSPEDVVTTVRAILTAGAVGMNLEDSRTTDRSLFSPREQAGRIRAAREAATEFALPDFVINVRTDVYLLGDGQPEGRCEEVIRRGAAYAEAGADCLFVPGLLELDVLEMIVKASPIPVNAMAGPGGPTTAELAAIGVRRISVGTALAQAAYETAQKAAHELLTLGTYSSMESNLQYLYFNALFSD